jgi:hypothetical protein
MNRYDDLELSGSPELEALRRTDELLDRLGRREPGPRDLDDPVAAALAVLAGDVDLSPVPVRDTREGVAAAGAWPLPVARALEQAPGSPEPECAEGGPRLVEIGLTGPRSVPDGESNWADTCREPLRRPQSQPQSQSRSRSQSQPQAPIQPHVPSRLRRSVARSRPQLDHPRVLRIRPSAGIGVAAALVLLGGGVSAAVTSDSVNPLTGIATVLSHLTDGRSDAQRQAHAHLVARVNQAKEAARQGDTVAANKIISEVQGQLQNLSGGDQKKIQEQITEVEGSLATSSGGATGFSNLAGTETSSDDGASRGSGSQNPAAASSSSHWSGHGSSHGSGSGYRQYRSSASGSTAESSVSSAGGHSNGAGGMSENSGQSATGGSTATRPDRPTWTGSTRHSGSSGHDSTPPTSSSDTSATQTSTSDSPVSSTSSEAAALSDSLSLPPPVESGTTPAPPPSSS